MPTDESMRLRIFCFRVKPATKSLLGESPAGPDPARPGHKWHTRGMARGWESKSIESQIEAAEERKSAARAKAVDAAEGERKRQRDSLLLSRTRILNDIEQARNPKYQETLKAALKHLDDKLAELG